ncbi:dihydroorotate dehydrogenase electron transfer subunit [Bacillota bacterium]
MCSNEKVLRKVFSTEILENVQIARGIYRMEIFYPEEERAEAGQFINVYLNRKDLLLPRPISICRIGNGRMTLVYRLAGAGTKELSGCLPGTFLRVSTPLGNGYNLIKYRGNKALIVGGGIGIPPLLELTHRLSRAGVTLHAVLGFKDEPFLIRDFEEAGAKVHLATDSGNLGYRGTVLQLMDTPEFIEQIGSPQPDICFACGPMPMLKALSRRCEISGMEIQVSLEERMGCGFGACLGCVCKVMTKTGIEQRRVCKDGPVFDGKEVAWDA